MNLFLLWWNHVHCWIEGIGFSRDLITRRGEFPPDIQSSTISFSSSFMKSGVVGVFTGFWGRGKLHCKGIKSSLQGVALLGMNPFTT